MDQKTYRLFCIILLGYCVSGVLAITNPSIAAICAGMAIIILFSTYLSDEFVLLSKYIDVSVAFFFMLSICYFQSRIVWIALLCAAYYILFSKYRWGSKQKFLASVIGILVSALTAGALLFKTESTWGRWHICKMVLMMIGKNPIRGMEKPYSVEFNHTQASYFLDNDLVNSKEALLAAPGYYPLNEYLYLTLKVGLPLALLIVAVFSLLINYYGKKLRPPYNTTLKAIYLYIAIVAGFSYPLHSPFVLAIICTANVCLVLGNSRRLLIGGSLLVLIFFSLYQVNEKYENARHETVNKAFHMGYINESDSGLEDLFSYRPKRFEYHMMKAKILSHQGRLSSSLVELEKAHQYSCNDNMHLFWAEGCLEINDTASSVYHIKQAIAMYPAKFENRDRLLQLYIELNDTLNIVSTAKSILELPEKIPSLQTKNYKAKALKALGKYPV